MNSIEGGECYFKKIEMEKNEIKYLHKPIRGQCLVFMVDHHGTGMKSGVQLSSIRVVRCRR